MLSPSLSTLLSQPFDQFGKLSFYLGRAQSSGPRSRYDHQIPASRDGAPSVTEPGAYESLYSIPLVGLPNLSRHSETQTRVFTVVGYPGDNELSGPKGPRISAMPLVLAALADAQLAREASVQIYFFQVPTARRLRPR